MKKNSDLEKKFEELHKEFREECKPFEEEFRAAEKKAKTALKKISEKYGFKVCLGLESYVPNSRDELEDELREMAENYIGGLDYDYGQDPGEWWSPSTC